MKVNYTHIVTLLDASFSMKSIIEEMRAGVNNYFEEQKKLNGECTVTIVQFSGRDFYEEICSFKNLKDVPQLTPKNYHPKDNTALIDSMCRLIDETGNNLNSMKEEDRPEKILFLCITDGEENNSINFTSEDLKDKITHQENKYNWQFVYLGANQDAFKIGSTYGMKGNKMSNFNASKKGINKLFESTLGATIRYRSSVGSDNVDFGYTQEEQDDMKNTK